jgi:hypothetical protein
MTPSKAAGRRGSVKRSVEGTVLPAGAVAGGSARRRVLTDKSEGEGEDGDDGEGETKRGETTAKENRKVAPALKKQRVKGSGGGGSGAAAVGASAAALADTSRRSSRLVGASVNYREAAGSDVE